MLRPYVAKPWPHNRSDCYVTKHARAPVRDRAAPRPAHRPGPGPRRRLVPSATARCRRAPAAPDPDRRRRAGALPHDGQRRLAAARPLRHHPHRRPARARPSPDRTDRRLGATSGPSSARPTSPSTCRPASPTPRCCPAWPAPCDSLTTAGTPGSYLDDPVLARAARDAARRQWPYAADELTVVDGAMDALDLIARTLAALRGPRGGGEPVLPAAARPAGVGRGPGGRLSPVDDEGLEPRGPRRRPRQPRLPPSSSSRERRTRPACRMTTRRARSPRPRCSRALSALVVEDDSAGGVVGVDTVSLGRWIPGQTAYIRSASRKSHGPDLRLAALSAPACAAPGPCGATPAGPGVEQPPACSGSCSTC